MTGPSCKSALEIELLCGRLALKDLSLASFLSFLWESASGVSAETGLSSSAPLALWLDRSEEDSCWCTVYFLTSLALKCCCNPADYIFSLLLPAFFDTNLEEQLRDSKHPSRFKVLYQIVHYSSSLLFCQYCFLHVGFWPWYVLGCLPMCKYLNFFPEKTLSQPHQSGKRDECVPDLIAMEVQRASSVLKLNVKKQRGFFSPKVGTWSQMNSIKLKSVWM